MNRVINKPETQKTHLSEVSQRAGHEIFFYVTGMTVRDDVDTLLPTAGLSEEKHARWDAGWRVLVEIFVTSKENTSNSIPSITIQG